MGRWLARKVAPRPAQPANDRFSHAPHEEQSKRSAGPSAAQGSRQPRTPHTVLLALFWDIHLVFGLAIDVACSRSR